MAEAAPTLVIFAHPAVERARINPVLLGAARAACGAEVRDLYELYPDFTIDVPAEQAALAAARLVVLQFPLYWFSAPAMLKEWTDLVLTHGFAYGEGGRALAGKTLACAFSTGGGAGAFAPGGSHGLAVPDLLRPYEQTARLCGMAWAEPFVVHGAAVPDAAGLARAGEAYAGHLARLAREAGG